MANLPAQRSQTVMPSGGETALQSLKSWALNLQGGETISAQRAALIPAARHRLETMLTPAAPTAFASELAILEEWASTFGIPTDQYRSAVKFYREGLSHLPADLLSTALRRVRSDHKWGMRLPKVQEIVAQIQPDLDEMHRLKMQLAKAAKLPVQAADPTPYNQMTPEQQAKVDAMLANLKKGFAW